MQNWAGNVTYSAQGLLLPRSVEEAQELIAGTDSVRPLGTRHSFSLVADSTGALLSTEHLDRIVELGETTVTVEAGIRYGELSSALHEHGLALANLASLPHISVGGAIATGTHGSGCRERSLAAAVSALELVGADGSIRRLRRGDDDFDGAVVEPRRARARGARLARRRARVRSFASTCSRTFHGRPSTRDLDEILAGAYSVSLFTSWTEHGVDQVWVKTTDRSTRRRRTSARRRPTVRATRFRARAGRTPPSSSALPARRESGLPHFRLGFTPSRGEELQSEYVVAREHGHRGRPRAAPPRPGSLAAPA